jgi:mono/diheme cytochrome c family protein
VRFRVLVLAALAWTSPLTAQRTDSLPAGVTAAMIGDGQKVFAGPGLCAACHGPQGKGINGLGPNLTDAEWLHSNGTYDALVAQITAGVPANKSKSGVAMPPKGGAALTDTQIRAVTAYVWSLGPRATK